MLLSHLTTDAMERRYKQTMSRCIGCWFRYDAGAAPRRPRRTAAAMTSALQVMSLPSSFALPALPCLFLSRLDPRRPRSRWAGLAATPPLHPAGSPCSRQLAVIGAGCAPPPRPPVSCCCHAAAAAAGRTSASNSTTAFRCAVRCLTERAAGQGAPAAGRARQWSSGAMAGAAGQPAGRPIVVAAFLCLAMGTQMLLAMYGLLSRWLQVRCAFPGWGLPARLPVEWVCVPLAAAAGLPTQPALPLAPTFCRSRPRRPSRRCSWLSSAI